MSDELWKPLHRYASLPGDPPLLRRDLAELRAKDRRDHDLPTEPTEES